MQDVAFDPPVQRAMRPDPVSSRASATPASDQPDSFGAMIDTASADPRPASTDRNEPPRAAERRDNSDTPPRVSNLRTNARTDRAQASPRRDKPSNDQAKAPSETQNTTDATSLQPADAAPETKPLDVAEKATADQVVVDAQAAADVAVTTPAPAVDGPPQPPNLILVAQTVITAATKPDATPAEVKAAPDKPADETKADSIKPESDATAAPVAQPAIIAIAAPIVAPAPALAVTTGGASNGTPVKGVADIPAVAPPEAKGTPAQADPKGAPAPIGDVTPVPTEAKGAPAATDTGATAPTGAKGKPAADPVAAPVLPQAADATPQAAAAQPDAALTKDAHPQVETPVASPAPKETPRAAKSDDAADADKPKTDETGKVDTAKTDSLGKAGASVNADSSPNTDSAGKPEPTAKSKPAEHEHTAHTDPAQKPAADPTQTASPVADDQSTKAPATTHPPHVQTIERAIGPRAAAADTRSDNTAPTSATAQIAANTPILALNLAPTSSLSAMYPVAAPRSDTSDAAVSIAGLPVEIVARAQDGQKRFDIRLDPPELGRIDVRLDVDQGGKVTSHLVVERADTLDLLRRDAPQLERALQHAGLNTDGGLQFSLRDQSFANRDQAQRDGSNANTARLIVPDEDSAATEMVRRGYGRLNGSGGGLDIRV